MSFLSRKFSNTTFLLRRFANARSTKALIGFFAVYERLPTSATLPCANIDKSNVALEQCLLKLSIFNVRASARPCVLLARWLTLHRQIKC